MHKLLAIFLAICIVNAAVVPTLYHISGSALSSNNLTAKRGDIASIIARLGAGGSSAEICDVIDLIEELKSQNRTKASSLLTGLGSLVGKHYSEYDFDQEINNTQVDLEVILQALINSGLSGRVDLLSILSVIVKSVANLLNLLIAVQGSALAYLLELLSPARTVNVSAFLQVLVNLKKAKMYTLYELIDEVAELLGGNISGSKLPTSIGRLTVNSDQIIAALSGLSGDLDCRGLLYVISQGLNLSDVVNGVLLAPLSLLGAIIPLLSSTWGDKQVNLDAIFEEFVKLRNTNGGNTTLKALFEALAKVYNMPLSLVHFPPEILNTPINCNDFLSALTGQVGTNGLVGVYNLVAALACVVSGALKVIASIPNAALSLVLTALSGVTGSINVNALKALLSGLGPNATLSQLVSLLGGDSSCIPSAVGNVQDVPQILALLLSGFSNESISLQELVALIGVAVPQLLLVTVSQVLNGLVVPIVAGVAGVLIAVLCGLVGGTSGLLGSVNGGLLEGILGGLLGGAVSTDSAVSTVTGSVGAPGIGSTSGSIVSNLLGGTSLADTGGSVIMPLGKRGIGSTSTSTSGLIVGDLLGVVGSASVPRTYGYIGLLNA